MKDPQLFTATYPYTYVDVGARWGKKAPILHRFTKSRWIGFEPDPVEYTRLRELKSGTDEYLPYAIAGARGQRSLTITAAPDWSSLLPPNQPLCREFNGLSSFLTPTSIVGVSADSLDAVAHHRPESRLASADYLKIDVQGAAYEVVCGATKVLQEVIALEVESELIPIYVQQALFPEVHQKLTANGFMLFDIVKNRCYRAGHAELLLGKGQLAWLDTFYLRDFRTINTVEKKVALAITAIDAGCYDYGLCIVDHLRNDIDCSVALTDEILRIHAEVAKNERFAKTSVSKVRRILGGWFFRMTRRFVDKNYWAIVYGGYPEYYFRRD